MSDLLFTLLQAIVAAIGAFFGNNPTDLELALIRIAQTSFKAYEQQTGKPIDPSLLNPIEPIP